MHPYIRQGAAACSTSAALPAVNLHRLLLKLWKCSAPKASCSGEFPAHRAELLPLASQACWSPQVLLMSPNSLVGGGSNHGPCPPSSHMVHHHTPASPSPFQAEAGHRAKTFQISCPSLSLLPVCNGKGLGPAGFLYQYKPALQPSPPVRRHSHSGEGEMKRLYGSAAVWFKDRSSAECVSIGGALPL